MQHAHTSSAADPQQHELVERARALAPKLRTLGEEISRARRVPDSVIALLYEAELMSPMRPKKFGGRQLNPGILSYITRELARGDGSVAWVYSVTNTHDHFIGLYPDEVQAEYWSSKTPLSASSYAPVGKAVPAPGGFRVSGTWSFASGIENSGWVVVGAIVGMLPGDVPQPDLRFFLLPHTDYRIHDDWNVMGLAGTGSKSVVIEDVFVPDARVLKQQDISNGTTPGAAVHDDDPAYRASAWALFGPSIAAAAVGLVQGAYEVTLEGVKARAKNPDPMFEVRKTAGYAKLAEVSATIDAAALLFDRAVTDVMSRLTTGQPLSVEIKARARRDHAFSTTLLRPAMQTLLLMGGGMGIRESNHIQRAFRDLQALSVHVGVNWETTSIQYGSVAVTGGGIIEPLF